MSDSDKELDRMAEAKKSAAKKTAAKKAPTKTANAAAPKPAAKKATSTKTAATKKSVESTKKSATHKADPSYQEIAELAHRYWLERGGHHGSDKEDWLRAEKELRAA